jgi:hypothetical protein
MPSPRRIIAKICFSQSIQRLANDKPAHFKKIAEEVQVRLQHCKRQWQARQGSQEEFPRPDGTNQTT